MLLRTLFILFVTVLFSLGCMGAVNSLTDLNLEFELAENAVHPSDFPASPPAGGEKLMSMGMTAPADNLNLPSGVELDLSPDQLYRLELISYEVSEADAASLMATAQQQVEGAGFTEISKDEVAVLYEKDGTLFLVVDPEADDDGALTLLRLQPVAEEAPPVP